VLFYKGKTTYFDLSGIPFKDNYIRHGKLVENDKNSLHALVEALKQHTENIFVYGTSIFRELNDSERTNFLNEFKSKTNRDFTIVTPEQESNFTVAGVLSGNDFKGRLAIMIAGGGSTEICIVEDKKTIEKHYNKFGVVTVSKQFPNIINTRPNLKTKDIDKFCLSLTKNIKNKADILVLAGGDFITFYDAVAPEVLEKNAFYSDELQPYSVTAKNMKRTCINHTFRSDLQKYRDSFPENASWWDGTRQMSFCVRAVAKKCGAKYIIPTRINMCLGIIGELKKQ
jgi:hypothetical protein